MLRARLRQQGKVARARRRHECQTNRVVREWAWIANLLGGMVDDRMKKHLPFVLALIVCLIAAPAEAQQNPSNSRVALLIANSNYPDVNPPLATPAKDASSVGEELKRLGFAVDIHANLGRGDTLKAIDAFISRINKGSTALF